MEIIGGILRVIFFAWLLMMVIRTLYCETFEKEETVEKEEKVQTCENACNKPATIMFGFTKASQLEGSRPSAMWICDECFKEQSERYSHTGKIGQCVIMSIESPYALAWYNEANNIKEES